MKAAAAKWLAWPGVGETTSLLPRYLRAQHTWPRPFPGPSGREAHLIATSPALATMFFFLILLNRWTKSHVLYIPLGWSQEGNGVSGEYLVSGVGPVD